MNKITYNTMYDTIENMNDLEIPKHKKKKQSSTSKSNTKSKHKHTYIECLFIENKIPHHGTYCSICGKIGNVNLIETEKLNNGMWRELNYDEVYQMYEHLEQIQIDDIFQNFIPISKSIKY